KRRRTFRHSPTSRPASMSTRSRQRRRSDELDRADNPAADDELTLRPNTADTRADEELGDRLDEGLYDEFYDEVTDEEIEAFLDEQAYEELAQKKPGFWNLPTAAGISLIGLGTLYSLQQMGLPLWSGLGELMTVLPWLAGILIILLGFGLLSWSPDRRRKKQKRAERRRKQQAARRRREQARREASSTNRRSSKRERREERREERRAARSSSRTARTSGRRKKLMKTREKKILGVASGIARFFGVDPTLIRIAFVLATIFAFPTGIALYILLGFVLPEEKDVEQQERREAARRARSSSRGDRYRRDDDDEPFIRIIRD
ncbi:MAG: PspC domain-containing protein, partial [Bacteroidota bacterium]